MPVLVAPLDWGLGHSTRCVPIIRTLLERQVEVVIGGEGRSLELLRREFPRLRTVELPTYNIRYGRSGFIAGAMLWQIPKLALSVQAEHKALDKLIDRLKLDAVISDNRFGLYSKRIPSVYITHQVMIRVPGWLALLEPLLYRLHRSFAERFSECWIPDFPGEPNLSGELAHKYPIPRNGHYIGLLSRFQPLPDCPKKVDIVVVLSGPEPQRTLFETLILDQLPATGLTAIVVQGITEQRETTQLTEKITLVSSMTADELNRALCSTDVVLMRSGYSGMMDIASLGLRAILVPTPGQTEQEYLAKMYHQRGIYFSQPQNRFDLAAALEGVKATTGLNMAGKSGNLLAERITWLLGKMPGAQGGWH